MKKIIKIFFITILLLVITVGGIALYIHYKYIPEIKLNGKEYIAINLNEEYKDEGAKVYVFNKKYKPTSIKGKVDNSKLGEYIITYTYKNKYLKNKVKVQRTIAVQDHDVPVIKLKGDKEIKIYVDGKYKEPGFEAIDGYDGDITDKVQTSNNIDFKKEGEYKVTYEVSDSSNNIVREKRKIIIIPKPTTTTSADKNGDNTEAKGPGSGSGQGLPILMYHFFYDAEAGEKGLDNNYMEIHAFEEQMKYLSDNNYYFPTWTEVANFIDGKITLPEKSVVVTIDDGHISFFKEAVPVIEKYNVKVTSFLITTYNKDKIFMHLKGDKFRFESHTHNMHRKGCTGGQLGIFRCINYDLGLADLKESINILGSSDAIAYPYGDVTNNVLEITKAAGFKVGVTTRYGKAKKGMDKYQLPRVRMSKGMSLESFKKSL